MRGRRNQIWSLSNAPICIPFKALGIYRPTYEVHGCVRTKIDYPPRFSLLKFPPRELKSLKPRKRDLSPSFAGHLEPAASQPKSRWPLGKRSKNASAHAQTQSLLLRLPADLLIEIWTMCIGDFAFEMNVKNRKLQRFTSSSRVKSVDGAKLLALSLTCRLMYLQTIQILYGENTFVLGNDHLLTDLERLLVRQRMDNIRYMHYYQDLWDPPLEGSEELVEWHKVWDVLASLRSLFRLRIQFYCPAQNSGLWRYEEARLLEDARKVVQPQTFDLYIPWHENGILELPCRIFRY